MRRRYEGNMGKLYPHIRRITTGEAFDIPDSWKRLDLFVVGGGGSGGAWYTWGYSPGGGGTGGQCVTYKDVPIKTGARISIIPGSGGVPVSVASNTPGKDGYETTVTIQMPSGGEIRKYTAAGGFAGKQCIVSPSNNDYVSLSKQGWTELGDSIGWLNLSNDMNVIHVYDAHGSRLAVVNVNEYPYTAPYQIKRGVPEFHEIGNPTHAAGGSTTSYAVIITDFTDGRGGNFENISERLTIRGGGGYGGGGAGGYYRSGTSGAGGRGGVVLRYWTASESE